MGENRISMVGCSPAARPDPDTATRGWIELLRQQLLTASARYVSEGASGTRAERLREASDLSGIPRGVIELEMNKP